RSAAAVRRWLADIFRSTEPDRLDDLYAVATELICNAVRHAEPLPDDVIHVRCELADGEVEFSVTDGGSSSRPRLRALDTTAADGRGLLIVGAWSSQWGVREEAAGRTVWARLPGTQNPVVDGP